MFQQPLLHPGTSQLQHAQFGTAMCNSDPSKERRSPLDDGFADISLRWHRRHVSLKSFDHFTNIDWLRYHHIEERSAGWNARLRPIQSYKTCSAVALLCGVP
jgi:hypothetical protein